MDEKQSGQVNRIVWLEILPPALYNPFHNTSVGARAPPGKKKKITMYLIKLRRAFFMKFHTISIFQWFTA